MSSDNMQMNHSAASNLYKMKVKNAYKQSVQTLTHKELTVRTHEKSAEYIELAIDFFNEKDLVKFRDNINHAIAIVDAVLTGLNPYKQNGEINEIVKQLIPIYNFILSTLKHGRGNNVIKNFEECATYLRGLAESYKQM